MENVKQFLAQNSNNRGHDELYILNSFLKMLIKNTHKIIVLPVNGILNVKLTMNLFSGSKFGLKWVCLGMHTVQRLT